MRQESRFHAWIFTRHTKSRAPRGPPALQTLTRSSLRTHSAFRSSVAPLSLSVWGVFFSLFLPTATLYFGLIYLATSPPHTHTHSHTPPPLPSPTDNLFPSFRCPSPSDTWPGVSMRGIPLIGNALWMSHFSPSAQQSLIRLPRSR